MGKVTIIDFLPRCLGPLPDGAAEYCSEYMSAVGIKEFYSLKYEPKNPEFWAKVELPNGADFTYVCMGVKASNYFMPKETLSDKGPGGGGWIHLQQLGDHGQKEVSPHVAPWLEYEANMVAMGCRHVRYQLG